MSDYRGRFRKTVFLTLFVATLLLFVAILLLSLSGELLGTRWISWPLSLLCLALASVAALIALGGVIGLRRDTLERAGKPYFSKRPRERSPSLITRFRRRVLKLLPGSRSQLNLRPGEWVRVRPFSEIEATLDENGCLNGLPFMPEMLPYCGKSFHVFRRAEKFYYYFSLQSTGRLRRLRNAVMLDELRCSGQAHGGCQASCHLIWKEGWLEAVDGPGADAPLQTSSGSSLQDLTSRILPTGNTQYVCQMTELPKATSPMRWHDPRHLLRDFWSGNVRFWPFLKIVALDLFNLVQMKTGGPTAPHREARDGRADTPSSLGLRPGDLVRVKSKSEIEGTLKNSRNRGLWFDVEMHRYCGGVFRVATRVETIIGEADGRMLTLKNPCIVLEGVTSTGEYYGLCPQNELIYWREVWLERVNETQDAAATARKDSVHSA
jgi:hypothetical protein